jgi:hypothetical protein
LFAKKRFPGTDLIYPQEFVLQLSFKAKSQDQSAIKILSNISQDTLA